MQVEQTYIEAARLRLYTMLLIGILVTFALSFACALDWNVKIVQNQAWLLNLIYHPIAGTLSILFLCFFVMFMVESKSEGIIAELGKTYSTKNSRMGMLGVGAASFVYISFNSYTLIQEVSTGAILPLTLGLHIILGVLLGVSIFTLSSSMVAKIYETSPEEFQGYLVAAVVISLIALILVVIIGNSLGLISLGNLR